jgi:ribosome-binding protein aMBF1 (putative translation factor)
MSSTLAAYLETAALVEQQLRPRPQKEHRFVTTPLLSYVDIAELLEDLPYLVREARRSRGLVQSAAAEQLGINIHLLKRIEHGQDVAVSTALKVLTWLNTAPAASGATEGAEPS